MATPALVDPAPPRCAKHRTRHGEAAALAAGEGRCDGCRSYDSWYHRFRRRSMKEGTWQGWVDAAEVYHHIRTLVETGGRRPQEMSEESGVALGTIRSILYGQRDKVHEANALELLALQPLPLPAPLQPGYVQPHGTIRRLRGLAYDGWTLVSLSKHLGYSPTRLNQIMRFSSRPGKFVERETAEKIRALADEFDGRTGPSIVTAKRARAKGWHPLDAWHDIDDPFAEPYVPDDFYVDMTAVRRILRGQPAPEYRAAVAAEFLPRERYAVQLAQRDEAVRAGSVPAPYGPGLSAAELGKLVGTTERTVQRVRARQLESEDAATAA